MGRLPVAREGWPFIVVPAAIAAGLWLAGRRGLAAPFAAASLASLGFFRDPEREPPAVPGAVLAPADGRVVERVYTPGRFGAAYRDEAGDVNERCALHLEGDGARVTVTQVAGAVA